MNNKDFAWLAVIIVIIGTAVWVIQNPDFPVRRGLDLQGGLQVLLEADVPLDEEVTAEQMDTSRQIIEQRVNALGVSESLVQTEGDRRILVELPGIDNPEDALALIQGTALLEFVDSGSQSLPEGYCIRTSNDDGPSSCEFLADTDDAATITDPAPTFETIMLGSALRTAHTETDQFGNTYITFSMQPDAADFFADYTRSHQGQFLTIVLDKQVISSPRISAVIDDGRGTITGDFTFEEAKIFATQLRFGSLPVPLAIQSTRQIGATLGEQSVNASIQAGAIGLAVVLLFMLIYYRLPGFLAGLALLGYALINMAVFKYIPVTLTLPAITGFLISTGMAVDANILVFERMKEEIRHGGHLRESIDTGFDRAWTSIRDSNIATLVICSILLFFGQSFGASAVKGFAITLAIGVMISMFTAVIITRTLVRIVMGRNAEKLEGKKALLGV